MDNYNLNQSSTAPGVESNNERGLLGVAITKTNNNNISSGTSGGVSANVFILCTLV